MQNQLIELLEKYNMPDVAQFARTFRAQQHGDSADWQRILSGLPDIIPGQVDFAAETLTIGRPNDGSPEQRQKLRELLRQLHPWRKGPFQLFDTYIDTEWRSDWKWQRVAPALDNLDGRKILDVGCGNGYYLLRMLGAGAQLALGIDPYQRYVAQFDAIKKYSGDVPAFIIPAGLEDFPAETAAFDTVFSMGILYHRRSPMDHLQELKSQLRRGGQLVLETLVIDEDVNSVLVPRGRYAKMRNVWFIPSTDALTMWLKKCGYSDVHLVDVSPTTTDEQRSTDWMTYESLPQFLDPGDQSKTIEGHPAPCRAVFTARRR